MDKQVNECMNKSDLPLHWLKECNYSLDKHIRYSCII